MRRIENSETLHGTRDGQLAIDDMLRDRFRLTERESACAALVKLGMAAPEIADRLAISASTAEKHLVSLRRKLGVRSTVEATIALLRLEDGSTSKIPDSYGVVLPVSSKDSGGAFAFDARDASADLTCRLRDLPTVEEMLATVLEDLREDGMGALFYSYLPLSAASFRKGDVIHRNAAPKTLVDALRSDQGAMMGRVSARLFAEPDCDIVLRLDDVDGGEISREVRQGCRRTGLRTLISLGSPFGTGYVVLTAFVRTQVGAQGGGEVSILCSRLRERLLLLQNVAYSFGALARTARLTMRERDALALVAAGRSVREVAELSSSSERAAGQMLKAAREKLNAATTTEAVAKAMALNALVFL